MSNRERGKFPGKAFLRPTVCRINLKNLKRNFKRLKSIKPVLAVIKADAYGHGAVAAAKTLASSGVSMFAVALIEEGIELRRAGIRKPILIGGSIYPFSNFSEVIRYNLIPTIASLKSAKALSKTASKPVRAHIKTDCGMNRIGIKLENAFNVIGKIAKLKNIVIDGVYTHFPNADTDTGLTRLQMKRFLALKARLAEAGIKPRFFHASNTAALRIGQDGLDLIRPGLGIYGLKPYPSYGPVEPVMSLVSKIVYIRNIRKGGKVSYGGAWKAKRDSVIATIPAGYADGLRRELTNIGSVLIRGSKFPVAGRVCMDMTMIDVTALKNPRIGEEVVLLGGKGRNRISAEKIARLCGTINYEICCGISKRVPRVYNY